MAEYELIAAPPLTGYEQDFGGIRLWAPLDMALVSIALPLGGEAKAQKAIKSAYGVELPDVGKARNAKGDTVLMRMASDQGFVLFKHETPDAEPFVASKLKGAAYTTDQTDVWAILEISGPKALAALERICPLDLHVDSFAEMDVARTVMEHLGVVILRSGTESWTLMSASSSAGTFLHALEVSIKNVN